MPDKPAYPHATRLVLAISLATALSILGDSLLYGILPLEAQHLGIALPLVGILLSANRLVRLLSNTLAGDIFERLGPRLPFILATLLAFLTTALYGGGWGFLAFLAARLGWGIAWSGLRQGGYQAVWAGGSQSRGKLMGMLWGLIRLGSALSVLAGGYLRDRFGYQVAIGAIAGVTLLALPIALLIRWPKEVEKSLPARQPSWHAWQQALRIPTHRWLLTGGFLDSALEGILISTAALFVASRIGSDQGIVNLGLGAGTIAGILLAVRWTSDLIFGPAFGALSDRIGQPMLASFLATLRLAALGGTVLLPGFFSLFALTIAFLAGAGLFVTLSAAAGGTAIHTNRPHLFIGIYTTANDAGSALGPLLAYSLGSITGLPVLYLVAGVCLTLSVWRYRNMTQQESPTLLPVGLEQ